MIVSNQLRTRRDKEFAVYCLSDSGKNNLLAIVSFIPINDVGFRRMNGSFVKNQKFHTDILRNLNTFEHDTGEFFLTKDLVAFSFDSMIDRMIITNYQGAVEVLEDEYYIEFKIQDKTNINPAKSYELVVLMYLPRLLRISAVTKDIDINFLNDSSLFP